MSTNLRPDASATKARRVGICGGGVAGPTLAARLARLGFAVTVLEARDEAAIASEGVFLTLAPNGMNGLRAIGLDGEVAASGIATTAIEILDQRGRRLALIDQSDHAAAFGAPSVTIRRGLLASLLVTRARAEGGTVRLGERVTGVTVDTDGVVVATEDGEALRFDLLAACDGLRSRVRGLVFPEFPEPRFTGLIGTGGLVEAADVPFTNGTMRMTFGREAFFGYIKAEGQPVFWFNSYAADAAPGFAPEAYAAHLRELHRTDPQANRDVLAAVGGIDHDYPIFDLPELPAWHRGPRGAGRRRGARGRPARRPGSVDGDRGCRGAGGLPRCRGPPGHRVRTLRAPAAGPRPRGRPADRLQRRAEAVERLALADDPQPRAAACHPARDQGGAAHLCFPGGPRSAGGSRLRGRRRCRRGRAWPHHNASRVIHTPKETQSVGHVRASDTRGETRGGIDMSYKRIAIIGGLGKTGGRVLERLRGRNVDAGFAMTSIASPVSRKDLRLA